MKKFDYFKFLLFFFIFRIIVSKGMMNHGSVERITRRIIAEDCEWTLQTVPYLRQLTLNAIVQNWQKLPYIAELTSERDKLAVLKQLGCSK